MQNFEVTSVRSEFGVTYTFEVPNSTFKVSISTSNELTWSTQGYFPFVTEAITFVIQEEKENFDKIFAWVPKKSANYISQALITNGFQDISTSVHRFKKHLYQWKP